jgi:hypothetical protein
MPKNGEPMRDVINAWSQLVFRDPEPLLRELRTLEYAVMGLDVADKVLRLRTNDLQNIREGRNAALFAHGMATATGRKVYFAAHEAADYDFVTSWIINEERFFCAVQLKELVPTDLNPTASLEQLLVSLAKYQTTSTVLAILLNRPAQLTLEQLAKFNVPFGQAWLFWLESANGSRWMIEGDLLNNPASYPFRYPEPTLGVPVGDIRSVS